MKNIVRRRLVPALGALLITAFPAYSQGDTPYYYGYNGEMVFLEMVPDKVGVIFDSPQMDGTIASNLDKNMVRYFAPEMETSEEIHGSAFLIRTRHPCTPAELKAVGDALSNEPGFVCTTYAYRANPMTHQRIPDPPDPTAEERDSLLTDRIAVVLHSPDDRTTFENTVLPNLPLLPLQAEDRRDYSEIGTYGYRLRVDMAEADPGENAMTIANELHGNALVKHAAPMFAPLHSIETTPLPAPNDIPIAVGGAWHLRAPNGLAGVMNPNTSASQDPAIVGINARAAWDIAYEGYDTWQQLRDDANFPRIVIACLDDGVELNYDYEQDGVNTEDYAFTPPTQEYSTPLLTGNPDLTPNQWLNLAEINGDPMKDDDGNGYDNDFYGWDFIGKMPTDGIGDPIPYPDRYANDALNTSWRHGSFEASIAAAAPNTPDQGDVPLYGTNTVGVCPTCQIMPVRYHIQTFGGGADGSTFGPVDVFYTGRAELAVKYAADTGANVMDLTMAIETYDPLFHEAIKYARNAKGCVIVSGGSNQNRSLDAFPQFPAIFPEIICVSGFGINARKFSKVNYGWSVDLVAPTGDIPGSGLGHGGGTSAAKPQVTGTVGLMLTVNPALSPSEVQEILQSTAIEIEYDDQNDTGNNRQSQNAGHGHDPYTGYGLLNAAAAVEKAKARRDATFRITVEDKRRVGKERNLVTLDKASGDLTIYNTIGASEAIPTTGNELWRILASTDPIVALGPVGPDLAGMKQEPVLHLAGILSPEAPTELATAPPGSKVFSHLDGGQTQVLDAYLSPVGDLKTRGKVVSLDSFDTPNPDGPIFIHYLTNATNLNTYIAESVQDGDVIELAMGTYPPLNFQGKNIVVRSKDPFDDFCVSHTIIQANGIDQRCVTFSGAESSDAALMGLTLTGPNGGGIVGGLVIGTFDHDNDPETPDVAYQKKSHARILYNQIVNNKSEFAIGEDAYSDLYPIILRIDGTIQGNRFGEKDAPNGRENSTDLLVCECDGIIRKNFFTYNQAGIIDRCDGRIVQNLFANNGARAPVIQKSGAQIVSNIFYKNAATGVSTGQAGHGRPVIYGGIEPDELTENHSITQTPEPLSTVEQNTFYGNTTPIAGASAVFIEYPGVIKNNILWENYADGVLNQIDTFSSQPNFCDIQGYTGSGGGVIDQDPLFVTTRLIVDSVFEGDFESTDQGDSPTGWTVESGGWTVEDEPITGRRHVVNSSTSGDDILVREQTEGDREFRFSYCIPTGGEGGAGDGVLVGLREYSTEIAGHIGHARLRIQPSGINLVERQWAIETEYDIQTGDNPPEEYASEFDAWYDVLATFEGFHLRVLWRKQGEPWKLIYDKPDAVPLLSTEFRITVEGTAQWSFDNVSWDKRNLDFAFNLLEGSPCIDPDDGDTSVVRDFDDSAGPLDGTPTNLDPAFRDIGAHEFPDLEEGTYWWETL